MMRRLLPLLLIGIALVTAPAVNVSRAQNAAFLIRIMRDIDSLTVYIPDAGGTVPLSGLTFATSNGRYLLEGYASFQGLPFDHLPTPICFRLLLASSGAPLPTECQSIPANRLNIQPLAVGNVFWYNAQTGLYAVLTVTRGDFINYCPAGTASCDLMLPIPPTPNPTATVTPSLTSVFTDTPFPTLTWTPSPFTPTPTSTGGRHGQIAFETIRDGNYEIYLMNTDGSDAHNLTDNPARDEAPAWSPDGSRIAFHTDRDGNPEIYIMNTDGSGAYNLTHNPAINGYPAWSPDGSQIAFQTNRDGGNWEIYVVNADGSGARNLTSNPTGDGRPAWSPDGSLIAFNTNRDGNFEIYVMNADGSSVRRLTDDPADDDFPAWSPDGSLIAYHSGSSSSGDIYVMNADGSDPHRITFDPSQFNAFPAWRP